MFFQFPAAWTRLVHRSGLSLLEQVQGFVEDLRPNHGHDGPIMTPRNQRVRNANEIELLNKGRRERILGHHPKADENNSSINTSPILGNGGVSRGKEADKKRMSTLEENKPHVKSPVVGRSSVMQMSEEGIEMDMLTRGQQDTRRRKSLKNPIDTETKNKLEKMKNDIEMRKMPPISDTTKRMDAIKGARKYLVSRSSLGSPQEDSDMASIASGNEKHGGIIFTQDPELLTSQKKKEELKRGQKREKFHPSDLPNVNQGDREIMQLPPHLQALKEKLKKMRYGKLKTKERTGMTTEKSKPILDLSGLKMAKEFDPRRTPLDFIDSGKASHDGRG